MLFGREDTGLPQKIINSCDSEGTSLRSFQISVSDYINHYPVNKRVIKDIETINISTPTYYLLGKKHNNCAVVTSKSNFVNQGVIINI